jgi:hypothetical protein
VSLPLVGLSMAFVPSCGSGSSLSALHRSPESIGPFAGIDDVSPISHAVYHCLA